jgi:hypothetical protein
MFGLAAIVAFIIALFLDLTGTGKGHFDVTTFALIGLLCLAIHSVTGWLAVAWTRG